ncbi:hypothetical protein ACFLX7_05275 [Chloroflexota bacterium]
MNYKWINTSNELISYVENVRKNRISVIALDIEGESNLHSYGEKLCLIQIFDGINGVLIDPFKLKYDNIGLIFDTPDILKVMYDASSDLSLLKNAHNIDIKSILDLRPAVDLLNYDKKDLHSVIHTELGIVLNQKRKYQKNNWTIRPISRIAIEYALNDVIHLLKLKDAIFKNLYAKKLLETFILKNAQIQSKNYMRDPENKYTKFKGYNGLKETERNVFKQVYDIRDSYAQRYNMSPHNIINNSNLINISKDIQNINEIHFPKRFSESDTNNILHELKSITIKE